MNRNFSARTQACFHVGWVLVGSLCAIAVTARASPEVAATPGTESVQAIEPPRALSRFDVQYPEGQSRHVTVTVELLIDVNGRVADATVIEGEAPFDQAALASVAAWRFFAARRRGQPVPARIRMQVEFSPPEVVPPPAPTAVGLAPSPAPSSLGSTSPPETSEPQALEVTVEGERPVGVKALGRAEVRQMPGAFGDPFRAIEALPGVTPIASGLPYFFIRGAPPGNVGHFFDGMPIPLLYHAAAGPGVIHPSFINNVDLYSGAYPARYGRYSGGIVAGTATEAEVDFRGEASIRLLDSGAFLEVPFAGGRGSATLAGRYSYTGLVISLLAPEISLGYWDYQGRVTYELNGRERVSLFGFGSRDFLSAIVEPEEEPTPVFGRGPTGSGSGEGTTPASANTEPREVEILDLTFHRLKAGYSRDLDNASTMNAALTFGLERTGVGDANSGETPADLRTRSIGAELDYETRVSPSLSLRTGVDVRLDALRIDIDTTNGGAETLDVEPAQGPEPDAMPPPSALAQPSGAQDPTLQDPRLEVDTVPGRMPEEDALSEFSFSRDDIVSGAWVQATWRVTPNITLTPGLRFDLYATDGNLRLALEPRIAARFHITDAVSLTHDFGIAHQPPSFVVPIPGLSGSSDAGLQQAFQSSAGIQLKLPWRLTGSATVFQNVIRNSTDVLSTVNLDRRADSGINSYNARVTAHSYGLELYIKRSLAARLGGYISYTLSRSLRSQARASGLSSFDRTHVLGAALAYDLGRRWRMGTRLMTYSGIPADVAYSRAAKNPPRTTAFYRVDWRLEKRWLIGGEGAWWALVIEVLNTTLNKEALAADCYAYGCREDAIGPVTLPSLGVEASF